MFIGRSIKNVEERCKFLTCQKHSATLCVLRQPPTATNDLQRSSSAPPTTSNVCLHSAPFSQTLDELCPERCSERGPQDFADI